MMNSSSPKSAVLCLFIFFVLWPTLAWARLELRGMVYILGEHHEPNAVKNTTIRIEQTGDSDVTTASGQFCLFLPDMFKAGDSVSLAVEKSGYQILEPTAGKTPIPRDPLKEPVIVRLDALGSHRFMSRDAFALLIEKVANEAKKPQRADEERQGPPDFNRYLKDWAVTYGFGINEVRAELDKWAQEVEAREDDPLQLGLAAFYKKKFGEAAEKFTESAKRNEQKLAAVRKKEEELKEQREGLKENVIRDYRLAGDAHYNDYRFQDALRSYRKALDELDKASSPTAWASLMNDIGNTCRNLGIRTEGHAAGKCLAEAVLAYREALTVCTLESLPQDWAGTQNNLGSALQEQGVRTAGEEGSRLLAEAVSAYRQALTVYTRESLPQDWAMTQNNLGITLREQGTRTRGEEGSRLLAQAVSAYRQALTVRTREGLPQQSATTQNNLGSALLRLASNVDREKRSQLFQDAVSCYLNVLKVNPYDKGALLQATFIYHEKLFQFEEAYLLGASWSERHGMDDPFVTSDFTEKHFTTARFVEAERLLSSLLPKTERNDPLYIPLCSLDIANLLALKRADVIPEKMDALIAALKQQPEDYTLQWGFNGTKHFIKYSPELGPCRDWLLSFFAALESGNREAILQRLGNLGIPAAN